MFSSKNFKLQILRQTHQPLASLTAAQIVLCILIRSNLKSSSHESFIVQKVEKCLAVLKRNIASRDKTVFLKLYKQLVRPHLEYVVCI